MFAPSVAKCANRSAAVRPTNDLARDVYTPPVEHGVAQVRVAHELEAAVKGVPAGLHDRGRLVAVGVALVEVVEPEAAELLVRERADVGVPEDDAVARTRHRRVVGHLAVVPAVGALDEQVPEQAGVLEVIVVAALHAAAVARIRHVPVAAAADLGRVVQEGEPERLVRARCPRPAGVELVLLLLDRADHVDPVEGDDGVVASETESHEYKVYPYVRSNSAMNVASASTPASGNAL